jgi:hypothetical protein
MLPASLGFAAFSGTAGAADAPRFGQPILPAIAAAWDMRIGSDGANLPAAAATKDKVR